MSGFNELPAVYGCSDAGETGEAQSFSAKILWPRVDEWQVTLSLFVIFRTGRYVLTASWKIIETAHFISPAARKHRNVPYFHQNDEPNRT
jgi:hypothetical protein